LLDFDHDELFQLRFAEEGDGDSLLLGRKPKNRSPIVFFGILDHLFVRRFLKFGFCPFAPMGRKPPFPIGIRPFRFGVHPDFIDVWMPFLAGDAFAFLLFARRFSVGAPPKESESK